MGGVRLGLLINALGVKDFVGKEDQVVTSIHYDSRTVEPGGLFVAIEGLQADGHHYVEDAISRGAVAVVSQKAPVVPTGTNVISVDDSRLSLAALSAAFYGYPSRELCIIGITGTNGKTTTSYLIEAILNAAGYNVGVIGTINYRFGGKQFDNPVTTPESLDLMRILRQMADNGVTHVILEVSSLAEAISSMEADRRCMESLARPTMVLASRMSRSASVAFWAFCRVMPDICSKEDDVSSRAAACSDAASARR